MPLFGEEERKAFEAERRAEVFSHVQATAEAAGYQAPRKLTEAIMCDPRFVFTLTDGRFHVGGKVAGNCTLDVALQRFVEGLPPDEAKRFRQPPPTPVDPAATIAEGYRRADRERAEKLYGTPSGRAAS